MYKALMILLAVFTLLDAVVTKVGLGVGCVELNSFVINLGLDLWTVFRLMLLGYLMLVFFLGYRLCIKRFKKGLLMLKTSLFMLNFYIGAIVFSGFFSICSRVFF